MDLQNNRTVSGFCFFARRADVNVKFSRKGGVGTLGNGPEPVELFDV